MANDSIPTERFDEVLQQIARDRELAAAKSNQDFKFVKQTRCVFDAYPADSESAVDGYQGETLRHVPSCWLR